MVNVANATGLLTLKWLIFYVNFASKKIIAVKILILTPLHNTFVL